MYYEEPRIPALPGEENVTDGSVDYYDTDWENVDNSALEEEMQKCGLTPCDSFCDTKSFFFQIVRKTG